MEMLQILIKGNLIVIVFLLFTSCSITKTKYDSIDKKACIEYERQLEFIENYNFYLIKVKDEDLVKARNFFEKLTGHKSEADIQFDGQLPPTVQDYHNWTAWYSINHKKLRYNKKTKNVYLIN
ncbi:hypothetical protein [uncultured Aquimarina sp.]|uniref:hypothetical protein n=1 Tax=uncultured Aquimarina sp. TaxID=575652 RepID=UPI002611BB98|nr:hypothetical protein [uncultured Aquimarina sp.]